MVSRKSAFGLTLAPKCKQSTPKVIRAFYLPYPLSFNCYRIPAIVFCICAILVITGIYLEQVKKEEIDVNLGGENLYDSRRASLITFQTIVDRSAYFLCRDIGDMPNYP